MGTLVAVCGSIRGGRAGGPCARRLQRRRAGLLTSGAVPSSRPFATCPSLLLSLRLKEGSEGELSNSFLCVFCFTLVVARRVAVSSGADLKQRVPSRVP